MKHLLSILLLIAGAHHLTAQVNPLGAPALRPDIVDTGIIKGSAADKHPDFTGGIRGWREFLTANLHGEVINEAMEMDTALTRTGVNQKVIVRFVVCEDGGICNLEVANKAGVHPLLAAEALRVMRLSPAWIPGESGGKKAKMYYQQPFWFRSE